MLKYVVNILVYLSLAVWIGSVLFFGIGVAAVVFKAGMLPDRTLAGALNSAILGRLGRFEVAAGVVLLGGMVYSAFKYGQWMNWTALGISVLMVGVAVYYTTILFPEVNRLRTSIGSFDPIATEKLAVKKEFDKGHQLYSTMTKGVLVGGLLVLMLHTAGLVRYAERRAVQPAGRPATSDLSEAVGATRAREVQSAQGTPVPAVPATQQIPATNGHP